MKALFSTFLVLLVACIQHEANCQSSSGSKHDDLERRLSEKGEEYRWLKGKSLAAGPKIRAVRVYAISDDNTLFCFQVLCNAMLDLGQAGMNLSGRKFEFDRTSTNSEANQTWLYGYVSKDDAEYIAKCFKVPCHNTADLWFKIKGEFGFTKERYRVGEKVGLAFSIKNVGDKPVDFFKQTWQRLGWDQDFVTTVTLAGKKKDRELPVAVLGGGTGPRSSKLLPGQTDAREMDASRIGRFDEPGTYLVTIHGRLWFWQASPEGRQAEWLLGRWEKRFADTVSIVVEESQPPRAPLPRP